MELCLDISGTVAVTALSHILPLASATTDPGTIAAGKKPLGVVLPQLYKVMGGQECLFAQVVATTAEGMVNDVRKLRSIIADIMVRVPVTTEGLTAIKMLRAEGIPALGTVVYGATQGLLSALVGAGYIAPYANRVDAQGGSGIQTAAGLHQLLKIHASQMKVLAASLKTPRQALDCLLAGCESTALPLDVAQQMTSYPVVDAVVTGLEQDWLGVFGRTSI